jgi:hypothetical protein
VAYATHLETAALKEFRAKTDKMVLSRKLLDRFALLLDALHYKREQDAPTTSKGSTRIAVVRR